MSDNKKPDPSDAALQARLNQLELENRMRHRFNSISAGADPFKDTPRKGFGSAQGIAHLRHTEYQRRGPSPPPPPPMIPEPGKAKFGGTYLRTPLPGVISGEVQNPWEELIPPIPAKPVGSPADTAAPSPTDSGASLSPPSAPKPPPVVEPSVSSGETPPPRTSGFQPAVRPAAETTVQQPVAAPPFDPGHKKVIGGSGIPKAPLPPLYHAGMRAAEQANASTPEQPPSAPLPPETPIAIPKEAEFRTDEPAKAPRAKRFKNPTLGPGPE